MKNVGILNAALELVLVLMINVFLLDTVETKCIATFAPFFALLVRDSTKKHVEFWDCPSKARWHFSHAKDANHTFVLNQDPSLDASSLRNSVSINRSLYSTMVPIKVINSWIL